MHFIKTKPFAAYLVAAIITILALSGCAAPATSDAPARPKPEATSSPTAPPVTGAALDAFFADYIRAEWPLYFSEISDADLTELGVGACELLDMGLSFDQVAMTMLEVGYPAEVSGGFIGASIGAYCPEHEDKING